MAYLRSFRVDGYILVYPLFLLLKKPFKELIFTQKSTPATRNFPIARVRRLICVSHDHITINVFKTQQKAPKTEHEKH